MISVCYLMSLEVSGERAWLLLNGAMVALPPKDTHIFIGRWNGPERMGAYGHSLEQQVAEVWLHDNCDTVFIVLYPLVMTVAEAKKNEANNLADFVQHYKCYGFKRCVREP